MRLLIRKVLFEFKLQRKIPNGHFKFNIKKFHDFDIFDSFVNIEQFDRIAIT